MDTKSALPLVWIIEILAHSNQVPLSVLIDLSSKIPKASDRVFTNIRELVSFRILDSIHSQQPTETCPTIVKSTIHPSQHCVDVLQRLMKNSASDMKAAAAEMSKWDIQPFLDHKRSSFPDCFLVKIKDAILTGNPPHLASLREQSGLPVINQPEPSAPLDGGDCNDVTLNHNISDSSKQVSPEKNPLISPVPANSKKYQLPENIPAKRKISAPTKDPITQAGNVEAIMKSAKKHKPDTIYSEKQIPHSMPEPPLDKSYVESSIAANASGYRESFSIFEITDNNERMRQEQDCDDQGQQEHEQTANVNMVELDQDVQTNVPNAEEAEKRESFIASDRHNNVMDDIAKKKEAFLSSQCTLSQDYLADSFSELMLCVKCNKGENVLICSNSCALAVHESCMISGASFDKDGKFYCPFCAYSRALSEYQEVKKKVSAARNELTKFLSPESRKETEKQPMIPNNLKQVDGLPNRTELKSKAICKEKLDCEMAGPSESRLPRKGKEVGSTKGKTCTESKHKKEKKRTRQVTHSPRAARQHQTSEQAIHSPRAVRQRQTSEQAVHSPRAVRQRQTSEQAILKSQNDKTLHGISEGSAEQVEIRSKKGVSCPNETDLHCEHKSSPSADSDSEEEISEYSSDNSYNPLTENDVRVLKSPEKQSLLRAQKRILRWTIEEEEKLKEAMNVICDEEHTIIPWTRILEYGAGTFDERRTAMHLKDKWRNICKAANKH